jgi:hypothetical protein
MADTIQLESFNHSLHGARILCQGPFINGSKKAAYPPILDAIQQLRDPFKKKILLTNIPFGLNAAMPIQYDATFHVKDAADWTLILTYLTYAPKPNLLVAEDVLLPDGLWSKLAKTTTVVNVTSQSVMNLRPYDAIFFAPMEETQATHQVSAYSDYVYKVLQSVYKANYSVKEHKEILQELRVANAGLMWSREAGVCWYDPVVHNGEKLTGTQLSELFAFLSTAALF